MVLETSRESCRRSAEGEGRVGVDAGRDVRALARQRDLNGKDPPRSICSWILEPSRERIRLVVYLGANLGPWVRDWHLMSVA
jgi:hypothetical protein